MGRGLSILLLLTMLGSFIGVDAYLARNPRDVRTPRQVRDGQVHVMDGGDGTPPPSTW